jgi:hypothetical protein
MERLVKRKKMVQSQDDTKLLPKPTTKMKKYDKRLPRRKHKMKQVSKENAMRTFYKEIDLPEFKEALTYSKDPKYQMLLYAINNPRMRECSFALLCKRCGLSLSEVASLWKDHNMSIGMMRAMGHVPQVMEDIAIDSKSRVVDCTRCSGEGKLHNELYNNMLHAICPECHGDGKIRIVGDKDARGLLYESVGLRKTGGINQNMNINVGGSMPSMEDVISDAEKAMDISVTAIEEVEDGEIRGRAEKAFESDRSDAQED